MRDFGTGAIRGENKDKPDYSGFISPAFLKAFGQYMLKHQICEDGSLRSSDNWKNGIPIPSYKESLIRHVIDFWDAYDRGDLEECDDLALAITFNIQGYVHEREKAKRKGGVQPREGASYSHPGWSKVRVPANRAGELD
jgi:hypothetical protein